MAFVELSAHRNIDGMSGYIFPIHFSEIETYMRIKQIEDLSDRKHFIARIKFMDNVYCKAMNEKRKK